MKNRVNKDINEEGCRGQGDLRQFHVQRTPQTNQWEKTLSFKHANHQLSTKILPVIARWVIYDTHSHSRSWSEQLGWWSRHWPAACQLRWTDVGLQDADTINQINDHRYIPLFFSTLRWLMYSSRSNERTDGSEQHQMTVQTVSPRWVGRRRSGGGGGRPTTVGLASAYSM